MSKPFFATISSTWSFVWRSITLVVLAGALIGGFVWLRYQKAFSQLTSADEVVIENCHVLPEELQWKAIVAGEDAANLIKRVFSASFPYDLEANTAGFSTYTFMCYKNGQALGKIRLLRRGGVLFDKGIQLTAHLEEIGSGYPVIDESQTTKLLSLEQSSCRLVCTRIMYSE